MDNIELPPENYQKYELSFGIIVTGDSSTGKSCFVNKAFKNIFDEYYIPTVGFDFLIFDEKINDTEIKLQIWVTAGNEKYRTIIKSFYEKVSLFIILYSIDDKQSFDNIKTWLADAKIKNPNAKIILVGNKSDLEDSRKIQKYEGMNFAKEHKLDMFFEVSAKSGYNVQKVFKEAAKLLYTQSIGTKKEKEKEKENKDKEKEEKSEKEKKIENNEHNKDKYLLDEPKDSNVVSFWTKCKKLEE